MRAIKALFLTSSERSVLVAKCHHRSAALRAAVSPVSRSSVKLGFTVADMTDSATTLGFTAGSVVGTGMRCNSALSSGA